MADSRFEPVWRSLWRASLCERLRGGSPFCFVCFNDPMAGVEKGGEWIYPLERKESVNPKATILIVDDEPDVREVSEEYFVAHGYAAIGAESAGAAKALAAAQAHRPRAGRHQHAGRGRPEPRAAPARALREDRDRHADFRRHGRRPDRRPRDGRRRLRPQALRSARAAGARQERAAPHVGRGARRPRRRAGAHRALRARPRRAPPHRRERAARCRCRRSSSIC